MPGWSHVHLRRRSAPNRAVRGGATLAAAVAGVVLAASGCGSSSPSGASDSGGLTTIRLSNTLIAGDEIPLVYGDSINIWKKYGIKLVEQKVSTSIQYTSLGAGQADIATGSPGSIEAATGGAPIKIVGQIGPDYIEMLAQKSIPNAQALRGTTLGSSAPGSVTAGIIRAYLGGQGLKPTDYKLTYFSGSFPAVLTALIAGRISATTAGFPYIAQAVTANPGLHPVATISSTPIGILGGNVMSVNTDWASSHGAALTKFTEAWNAATKQSAQNRTAAIAALSTATKTSTAVATEWFDKQSPLDGWYPLTSAQFKIVINSLTTQYPDVATASYSKLVDNSYVKTAG